MAKKISNGQSAWQFQKLFCQYVKKLLYEGAKIPCFFLVNSKIRNNSVGVGNLSRFVNSMFDYGKQCLGLVGRSGSLKGSVLDNRMLSFQKASKFTKS